MEGNFVKITNVTYKVLDFFPDGDPLKNKAKEKALAILENLTLISDAEGWISLQKEKAAAQLLDDIEILESYLTLGKYQGWIDTINFLIIVKEYEIIKRKIHVPKGFIEKSLKITSRVSPHNITTTIPSQEKNNQMATKSIYSERQKNILRILSQREKTQVSDIIKELPEVTKRTIRRDLDDLLKRGKIVRIGAWNQIFYRKIL